MAWPLRGDWRQEEEGDHCGDPGERVVAGTRWWRWGWRELANLGKSLAEMSRTLTTLTLSWGVGSWEGVTDDLQKCTSFPFSIHVDCGYENLRSILSRGQQASSVPGIK